MTESTKGRLGLTREGFVALLDVLLDPNASREQLVARLERITDRCDRIKRERGRQARA